MKYAIHLYLLLASLCSVSCTSHLAAPSTASGYNLAYSRKASTQARVMIKTATMKIQVSDVQQASNKARLIIKEHKGYLESIDSSDDKNAIADLELRVPKNSLVSVMDGLATLGKVTRRNIQVEDVTGRWIDLQAKVKNMRALRDRLRTLLRQANEVKETLTVEKELTRVQSELDSLEGKIKAMQRHVAYSKLTLRIRQKSIPGPIGAVGKGAWWGIKKLFVLQ